MSHTERDVILKAFREAVRGRPACWADERTLAGDVEGREETLQIFDVEDVDQRGLLTELRPVRLRAEQLLGRPVRVMFHTPDATTRYYSHVRQTDGGQASFQSSTTELP
jgi:hypothetical protein